MIKKTISSHISYIILNKTLMKKIKSAAMAAMTSILFVILISGTACINKHPAKTEMDSKMEAPAKTDPNAKLQKATFAMGCFWHSEEMFSELKGVTEAL